MATKAKSNGYETEVLTDSDAKILEIPDASQSASNMGIAIRAELDVQIVTARAYPRNLSKFKRTAIDHATIDVLTAQSCIYSLERWSGGKKKYIIGPSVRLAEIAAAAYTNVRVSTSVLGIRGHHIYARTQFMDLENNYGIEAEVSRRVTDRDGKLYNDDMIQTTAAAVSSIAFRNGVFRGLPRVYINQILDECKRVASHNGVSLDDDRRTWIDHWAGLGVDGDRLFSGLGILGPEEITTDTCLLMTGLANRIEAHEISLEDVFPQLSTASFAKQRGSAALAAKLTATSQKAPGGPARMPTVVQGTIPQP